MSLRKANKITLSPALKAPQPAEKLARAVGVVVRAVGRGLIPGKKLPTEGGGGFNPRTKPAESETALAAEDRPHASPRFSAACLAAVFALLAALPAAAQYAGKVAKDSKENPELRSIAVLEWTGEEGNPKASRLVPVSILDGDKLQDGSIYLARPEPMAVAPMVEYQLEQDGKPLGLFDVDNSGQELGSWVGFGAWKPMPSAHPKLTAAELAKLNVDSDDEPGSDEPVLHRKHHGDDAPAAGSSSPSSASSDADTPAAPSDPDRPVLHKKTDTTDTAGTGSGSSSAPADDPDRPVLKKSKTSDPHDTASVDSVPGDTDPGRPRLKRGKSNADAIKVAPSLLGLPPDLQQTIAVSDAKTHADHPWDYSWTTPADEAKMKSALEDIARNALGLTAPASAAKPAAKRTTTTKTTAKKTTKPPPPPAPLVDEQYRVFELAYGSGATLVLSAHTDGPITTQKFVTLIAQPDLYGNVLVLKKNVADGAHLDETPRMRLVDAVDALADNRGELLFELRGATQRQFALYRVLRGQAEQLFVTGGGQFGMETSER